MNNIKHFTKKKKKKTGGSDTNMQLEHRNGIWH